MSKMSKIYIVLNLIFILSISCNGVKVETNFQEFLEQKISQIEKLEKERNLAYWESSLSGTEEAAEKWAKAEFEYKKVFSDSNDFAKLKKFKESGEIKSPLLSRQLDILYFVYLKNQMDPDLMRRITDLESKVDNKFSTFRGTIDGKEVTNNQILEILKKESGSNVRKKAWEASKRVGQVVEKDLIQLVQLRNEVAKKLGYENFYLMSLELAELNEADLMRIFDELAALTDKPFKELKTGLDENLANRTNTIPAMLRPWHYHDPFFQEAPVVFEVDLDKYYSDKDVKELSIKFYDSIGLPVNAIYAQSDIYEKDGKNPHAFCTHIDRSGDVRILMNLKNDVSWMETALHELGHGVYDYYLDFQLPFILREPAHTFTTEAIAMFFGRLARNANWMQEMLGLSEQETTEIQKSVSSALRLQQLIFSRWCQVMVRFERELYSDPDQDLNTLWWDLVEKYQYITRPANRNMPDWAAKIHFTIAPVYYHNYMLGELMASQIHTYLINNILNLESDASVSYVGKVKVGEYLKDNIFEQGARLTWSELLTFATGETLNPVYYVNQFITPGE